MDIVSYTTFYKHFKGQIILDIFLDAIATDNTWIIEPYSKVQK